MKHALIATATPAEIEAAEETVQDTKAAQKQGKRVLWITNNQTSTAALLSRHGALSEISGEHYVEPHFKKDKSDD